MFKLLLPDSILFSIPVPTGTSFLATAKIAGYPPLTLFNVTD